MTSNALTWNATAEGYERSDKGARLVRSGKKWSLVLASGAVRALPRRASFNHADRLMAEIAGLS